MTIKTIIIFANSVKHGKHCVAGKDISTNQWVRPVASQTGAELSKENTLISNPYGNFPVKPLQKVEITFQSHTPLINQPENWLINKSEKWIQNYKINDSEIVNYLDIPENLWGNTDRVAFNDIQTRKIVIQQSLYLVHVSNLHLYKNTNNKRRANFIYNTLNYDLAVTDRNFDNLTSNGESLYPKAYLCVSLGEVFNDYCYKIVAWIYIP